MRRKNGKSLLTKIAREAGVSVMTVSRVMRGYVPKYRPAQERARRVLAVAARYNYRPSAAARAMATGRYRAASLLLPGGPGTHTVLFAGLLDGIHDRLAEADYHLNIARLPEDAALTRAGRLPKILRETLSDGLLINYARGLQAEAFESICRLRAPLIWINYGLPTDSADLDDLGGARRATERLIARGHRRIAYAQHMPSTHYSATERAEGYASAMRGARLPPVVWPGSETMALTLQEDRCVEWLRSPGRPTAVLCYSRQAALIVVAAARAAELSVPGDLAVVQFGEHDPAVAALGIVTVELPWYELGKNAAAMLLEKIAHPQRPLARRMAPLVQPPDDALAPPAAE